MTVKSETVEYKERDTVLEGHLYQPETVTTKHPAILVYPAFWGPSPHEKKVAHELAELGFIALVADVYGKGVRPQSREDAFKALGPYFADREGLLKPRILAAYNYITGLPNVDKGKVGAIGYCFGGTCVLDLARYNVNIVAGVSFHGGLKPIKEGEDHSKLPLINTSLLICHGDADEHVNPTVPAFLEELRARKADFQFINYAKALHGFTMEKEPAGPPNVGYDEKADRRSKLAMLTFFNEIFGIPNKDYFLNL
uniref:DLH domain-containing protein n=2 Tax=Bursaphelenchus xylophilus TaxID=6326 RepID=A0A1I7SVJ2_BURXY